MMADRDESIRAIAFIMLAVIGAFCIIHLTWYWGIKIRYDDAIWDLYRGVAMEEYQIEGDRTYEVMENGYHYRIYGTSYLANAGFACIGAETGWLDESERSGNILEKSGSNVILNIGFKVFCHYSFQIDIESADGRYQMEVDQHGNLIADEYADPEYKEKMDGILEQNRVKIDQLFCHANEKWNIQ